MLDNAAVDKELRRWQDAIRNKLVDLGAPDWKIDGAGCDSGDPLDFTLAEVGQGCGWFIDKAENAATLMRDKCVSVVKGLWTTNKGNDYNGALNDVLRLIESLTLDTEEQEKQ